jgi:hypothetical protein
VIERQEGDPGRSECSKKIGVISVKRLSTSGDENRGRTLKRHGVLSTTPHHKSTPDFGKTISRRNETQ